MKAWHAFVLGAMFVTGLMFQGGCGHVTPAQDARIDRLIERGQKIEVEAENARAALAGFLEIYDTLKGKADAIMAAIASGEIPGAEGVALLQEIESQKDAIEKQAQAARSAVDGLVAEGKAAYSEVKALRAAGVPWYVIVGRIGTGLLLGGSGGLALYFRRKLGIFGQVIGALSRAGDVVGHEQFGAAVATEIKAAPGLSQDIVRPLHHASTEGNL